MLAYSKLSESRLESQILTGGAFVLIGQQRMNYVYDRDDFTINANVQVSNQNSGTNIGWTLYLARSFDGTNWSTLPGTRQGQNVNSQRHHDCMFPSGSLWYRGDYREWIDFGVFARCYTTQGNGMPILIDRMGLHVHHVRRDPAMAL